MIIPTVAQENPNNKFPCKIICKKNHIIRDLEIYKFLKIRTWQLMMIYKHDLWNLPTKITFFFSLIYLFNVLFL